MNSRIAVLSAIAVVSLTTQPPALPGDAPIPDCACNYSNEVVPQQINPGHQVPRAYKKTSAVDLNGESLNPFMRYLLYTPPTYDSTGTKLWPLIVDFPGNGQVGWTSSDPAASREQGTGWEADLQTNSAAVGLPWMLAHGLHKAVAESDAGGQVTELQQFVVISVFVGKYPVVTNEESKWVACLLRDVIDRYKIDKTRVYFTGLCGGAVWSYIAATMMPGLPAGVAYFAFPGEGVPGQDDGAISWDWIGYLKNKPERVRTAHDDEMFGGHGAVRFDSTLDALNGNTTTCDLERVPGSAHNTWEVGYNGDACGSPSMSVYAWFLSQSNPNPSTTVYLTAGTVGVRAPSPAAGLRIQQQSRTTAGAQMFSLTGRMIGTFGSMRVDAQGRAPGVYCISGGVSTVELVQTLQLAR